MRHTSSRFTLRATAGGLVLALLASMAVLAGSQTRASAQELDTTMLLFDLSGSMDTIDSSGQSRLQVAQAAMIDAIEQLAPGSRNVGIRGFSDCGQTTLEYPPAPVDKPALNATISSLTTGSLTDISSALTAVASDFAGLGGRHSVVLLSDGAHNCGGDPCVVAQQIIASGIDLVVHAVGIGTAGTRAETQLACIAGVTGGTTISVDSSGDLFDAIDTALTAGATSATIVYSGSACINSAEVQGNPALADAAVGDSFTNNRGARTIITTGPQCGVDCSGGFDMNCDGVLGDYCPADIDRNTVSGLAECLRISAAPAPTTFELLEGFCLNNTGDNARFGFVLPEHLVRACNHLEQAEIYQDRADQARISGDADMIDYWGTLADDQTEKALAAFDDLPVPDSRPVPIPVPAGDNPEEPIDVPTDVVDQVTQLLEAAPHFKYLMEAEVYWQSQLNCLEDDACSKATFDRFDELRAQSLFYFENPPETPGFIGWCLGLPDGLYPLGGIEVPCITETQLPSLTEFLVDVAIGVACGAAIGATPLSAGATTVAVIVICGPLASVGGGIVDNLIDGEVWYDGIASDAAWGLGGAGIGEFLGRSFRIVRNLRAADGLSDDVLRTLCRSFGADTKVLMADGSHVAISAIQVGDMVQAEDPVTGEAGAREVTAVWPHQDMLLDFRVDGGTVTTTEDHHLWNETDQEWQETQTIDIGDQLRTADGTRVTAEGLDWASTHVSMAYDLTVDDIHTYFVSVGTSEVLAHNCTRINRADIPSSRLPAADRGTFWVLDNGGGYRFVPNKASSFGLSQGDSVVFRNAPDGGGITADLAPYVATSGPAGITVPWEGTIYVPGMTGSGADKGRAVQALAERYGIATDDMAFWLAQNKLDLHHFGCTMQIVARSIHGSIAHNGSASFIRNGDISC